MGLQFMDKFSLLHFAVGIVLYFWGFSFWLTIFLHILFEWIENTQQGMKFINTYITMWPGGKYYPDSLLNSTGDIFFTGVGWYVAHLVSKLDSKGYFKF
jgi:hypothetical protein